MGRPLPTALSLAVALAAPAALAAPQDAAPAAAAGDTTKPDDLASGSDLRGMRCRVLLKRGAAVDGVLPAGIAWERRAEGGGFATAKRDDPGAGIRVFFVMGMDGEIFLEASQVDEVVERGSLSDEQAEEMRIRILQERRRALEERRKALLERETALQRELEQILGGGAAAPPPPPPTAPSAPTAGTPAPAADAGTPSEDREVVGILPTTEVAPASAAGAAAAASAPLTPEEKRRKADALLEKFPPPAWTEERYELIYNRERVAKIAPDTEEAEFVAGYDLWKDALDRRQKAAADARRAAAPNASAAGN